MPHDALDAGPGKLAPEKARKITSRVTSLSVGVALTLVAAKTVAWALSGSVAMLATLADSALDLAASLTTFFAVRYAASPADAEHRYGHGKAEAFASLLQALLVALSAGLLMREAYHRFVEPHPIEAGGIALSVMGLSILLTVGLVWAQTRALKQTESLAVTGDRAHYAADLAANGVVIVGLVMVTMFGIERADPVAGFAVSVWLFWTAWEVGSKAFENLMDRELPDADRERILQIAGDDPRVLGVHQLRTRASGPFIHIQLHMDLDPHQSLRDAHKTVVAAERRLMAAYPAADILIHPDPKGFAEPHGNVYFSSEASGAKVDGDVK
ncbi:cation transporter [Marinicauda salina]|uniref:Cation transporter n=1 Tax=Marinicauda salina TaxID=2135793 RepID=A0A2U2BWK9_9PROT|nr:cation diffusion facilitator family transporter [Marinicauda salina]PWE18405.1 cation transporter [Marinicauda salina]